MKRIVLTCLFLLLCNIAFAETVKNLSSGHQNIGVVIIGSSDFKTQDFYEYLYGQLRTENNPYNVIVGNDPQNKYMEYWLEQGALEEQTPKKDDLLKFVDFSKYDKVLYCIVKDPVIEKHSRSVGLFDTVTQTRASITINAFLCTSDGIVKTYSVSKQDDSQWSDMRAKMGAMKKCARDIGKALKPYFTEQVVKN